MLSGDTLFIRGGEYRAPVDGFQFGRSGEPGQPITVTNAPGERVVIRGTYSGEQHPATPRTYAFCNFGATSHVRIVGTEVAMQTLPDPDVTWPQPLMSGKGLVFVDHRMGVYNASGTHWEVSGVETYGNGEFGIFMHRGASDCHVHHNDCHHNDEHGMQLNGDRNVVEFNSCSHSDMHGANPYGGYGINILGSHNVVRANWIGSVPNAGILLENIESVSGMYHASDNEVYRNDIEDCYQGVWVLGGDRNVVSHNHITTTDPAWFGVGVSRHWAASQPHDNVLTGNEVVGPFRHEVFRRDDVGTIITEEDGMKLQLYSGPAEVGPWVLEEDLLNIAPGVHGWKWTAADYGEVWLKAVYTRNEGTPDEEVYEEVRLVTLEDPLVFRLPAEGAVVYGLVVDVEVEVFA